MGIQILIEMDGMSGYHAQCMDNIMKSCKEELDKKLIAEVQDKQKIKNHAILIILYVNNQYH